MSKKDYERRNGRLWSREQRIAFFNVESFARLSVREMPDLKTNPGGVDSEPIPAQIMESYREMRAAEE